jgi:hypothetical protein
MPDEELNIENFKEFPLLIKYEIWVQDSDYDDEGYYIQKFEINNLKFELLLHNTIRKIINDNEEVKISQILVNCELNISFDLNSSITTIEIIVPQEFYEFINNTDKQLILGTMTNIIESLSSKEKGDFSNYSIKVVTGLIIPKEHWRQDIGRELLKRIGINNQGRIIDSEEKIIKYNFLRFRSPAEVSIAKELDKYNILYFPLPVSVIKGIKKEPDFLIQHHKTKKFGILEIQGDTYHTPTNAQQDHERANIFQKNGVFVKFISAKKCLESPYMALEEFFKAFENF